MSKYLSLCNQLVSIQSTCKAPLPASSEHSDNYMRISGILAKARLSHDELLYGGAVVGDGFHFEVRLQQRARLILALSFELNNDKVSRYSTGLAELAIAYIRGKTAKMNNKEMAVICGCEEQNWRKRYKKTYAELCDWCNELETSANVKVWGVLEKERKCIKLKT